MGDTIALPRPWRNKLGGAASHWLRSDKRGVDRNDDFQKKIIFFYKKSLKKQVCVLGGWSSAGKKDYLNTHTNLTFTHHRHVVCVSKQYSLFNAKDMDKLYFCCLHQVALGK